MSTARCLLTTATLGFLLAGATRAQEAVRLAEDFSPGHHYRTSAMLTIQGRVALPAQEKGKPPQIIDMSGRSALVYEERVLPPLDNDAIRTIRVYREADLHRKQGPVVADHGIRPSVRRMIFLRNPNLKIQVSPDGPLTWDEIDLLSRDVYDPITIPGILPNTIVRVGQSWRISPAAVAELTEIEKVESGELVVKFLAIATVNSRRVARLSISGTVRGVNEDGPNRQSFDGSTAYFDLDSGILTHLSIQAVKEMLDGRGTVVGRTEGRFTVSRSVGALPSDLSDTSLRGLELKPTVENSLLLYEHPGLGVRFLHPRTWRVDAVQGRQVAVKQPRIGGGLLITVEPAGKVPTPEEYLKEVGDYFQQNKAKGLRLAEPTTRMRSDPTLDRFAIEAEMNNVKTRFTYAVLKQSEGGATVQVSTPVEYTARLAPEVERMLRSIAITRRIEAK